MIQGPLNSMTNAKENQQHFCVQGLSNLQRIKLSSLNTGLGTATCRQVKVENLNKSLNQNVVSICYGWQQATRLSSKMPTF
jgi:hypothetical protein